MAPRIAEIGQLKSRIRRWARRALPAAEPFSAARYQRWLADCERPAVPTFFDGPRFSVITRDERTRASLSRQTYRNWESVESPPEAGGEYAVAPGVGDELAPDALYLLAEQARAGADLIYSDEDRLDEQGRRTEPWFKPDWSPDLFDVTDYIGPAMAFRRELGGGAARQIVRAARKIVHIPRVLYHRRSEVPDESRDLSYPIPDGWCVDIVIPSRNAQVLARCLESVAAATAYAHRVFTVIDNSSTGEVSAVARRFGARLVDWRGRPFDFAAMNNEAARGTAAPALLFLNDDTSVIAPGWLGALVQHAARPEVGAVGARLLYPDGSIQHAGVAIGIYGVCGHVFRHWPANLRTYHGLAETVRNVSAVTGACLMVRTGVFQAVGGFDADKFPVAYNDIDLCLRIGEAGKRVLYTPHALLCHHEAHSKSLSQITPERSEVRAFQVRWRKYIEHDPFYNPNLAREDENCGLRERPCPK